VSRPLDRSCQLPELGEVDRDAGEFWVPNAFRMPQSGHNLSAWERNALFLNTGDGEFTNVSFASGAEIDADSRTAIAADFDRDGRVDLLVASVGGGPLRLFRNRLEQAGRGIAIILKGADSQRSGIGTRMTAVVAGRRIVRDLFPEGGFAGQGPCEVLIGIGDADHCDELLIDWPSGTRQVFQSVAAGTRVRIHEDRDALEFIGPARP
jgi:hypothetical protein